MLAMRILGITIAVMVGLMVLINASVMVVSPKAWFRLPSWLAGRGNLSERKYATGRGAVQLQILGGLMLAGIAWVIFDMVSAR
jgi:hypothetical protein